MPGMTFVTLGAMALQEGCWGSLADDTCPPCYEKQLDCAARWEKPKSPGDPLVFGHPTCEPAGTCAALKKGGARAGEVCPTPVSAEGTAPDSCAGQFIRTLTVDNGDDVYCFTPGDFIGAAPMDMSQSYDLALPPQVECPTWTHSQNPADPNSPLVPYRPVARSALDTAAVTDPACRDLPGQGVGRAGETCQYTFANNGPTHVYPSACASQEADGLPQKCTCRNP